MQDINGFRQRRDIDHSISSFRTHSQLPDAWTHRTQRLPVRGRFTLLNFPELETDLLARHGRERTNTLEAVADPHQRLETHYIRTDIDPRRPILRCPRLMG